MASALTATVAPVQVRVAGFWQRLCAGVIDGLVLASVFAILGTLVALVLGHPLPRVGQLGPDYLIDMAINGGVAAETGLVLLVVLGFFYFFLFSALRGQTFGKHLMKLRVIDAYGERPSIPRALARTVAYVPSLALLALGFLWIGFDRQKRGLHDWIADTYVVKV